MNEASELIVVCSSSGLDPGLHACDQQTYYHSGPCGAQGKHKQQVALAPSVFRVPRWCLGKAVKRRRPPMRVGSGHSRHARMRWELYTEK